MHPFPTYRLRLLNLALAAAAMAQACDLDDGELVRGRSNAALLTRAESCDDLLARIQDDARAKVDIEARQYYEWYVEGGGSWGRGGVDAAAGPSADGGEAGGATPPEHSETTTQVEGVDEADFVKTDGFHLYVLHENRLAILKSWPAEETALETTVDIEGYPQEMFVAEGRAVVFSWVEDPRADAPVCEDHYRDYGYYYPCWSSEPFTKVTVIELDGDAPAVARELYFEGYYNTSRRHGDIVRAVLANWGAFYSAEIPYIWEFLYPDATTYEELTPELAETRIRAWRGAAHAAIADTALADWLPAALEREAAELVDLPLDCTKFYVTRPGMIDYGLTHVVGFDLGAPAAAPRRAGIWGYPGVVYSNHESLVIAQDDWSRWYEAWSEDDAEYSNESIVHLFSLTETGGVRHVGSGVAPGSVGDQFSVDEKDGVVRLATTQWTWRSWWRDGVEEWTPPPVVGQVVTLGVADGGLELLGTTGALAENEGVQSARFLGDLAYVVTFLRVDPLFAIDLSDPARPTVLGELEIPGFSTYMHPLGEDHLLTIGYDADPETGVTLGLALQIFDISDPAAPSRTHRYVYTGDDWGYSEANWNHKAFTFFPERGLLSFPYFAWGHDWHDYRSSLEVFRVDAATGFAKLGSIDHSDLVEELCEYGPEGAGYCWSYGMEVRRGVFIEDFVYSISYGGVRVHDVDDLTTPVTTVEL